MTGIQIRILRKTSHIHVICLETCLWDVCMYKCHINHSSWTEGDLKTMVVILLFPHKRAVLPHIKNQSLPCGRFSCLWPLSIGGLLRTDSLLKCWRQRMKPWLVQRNVFYCHVQFYGKFKPVIVQIITYPKQAGGRWFHVGTIWWADLWKKEKKHRSFSNPNPGL